jgi:hypothetical protein
MTRALVQHLDDTVTRGEAWRSTEDLSPASAQVCGITEDLAQP